MNTGTTLLNSKWNDLIDYVSNHFGGGEQLDMQAILFLIGINELGQGYKDFSKSEKLDLLHIALCKLLSRYNYFEYIGRGSDGWPSWKSVHSAPKLTPSEQELLLKESIIIYFETAQIDYKQ
tara:strand:+ start:103 stop:468 length:366 start_codon:yes stop_codon:yes gene_type:complete